MHGFICQGLQQSGSAHGNRGLSEHHVIALDQRSQRFDDRPNIRGIRSIRALFLRGSHSDEVEIRELRGLFIVRGEPQPSAVQIPLQQLREARFKERHLSFGQGLDLCLIHVHT